MATANFQNQVVKVPGLGVPGDKASLNPIVTTDRNYIAGDAAVKVGNFVWADPLNPVSPDYHGSGVWEALSTGGAGVLPLGVVVRNLSYVNYDILSGATLTVAKGANLTVVTRADLYAVATTAATKGQKVFATLAGGAIQTGAAGATIAGAIETPWFVVEGGVAGELITISAWRQ